MTHTTKIFSYGFITACILGFVLQLMVGGIPAYFKAEQTVNTAFVNLDKLYGSIDYFRRRQREWSEDKKLLQRRYKKSIMNLRSNIPLMSLKDGSLPKNNHQIHKDSEPVTKLDEQKKSRLKTEFEKSQLRIKLKTLATRKKRVDRIVEKKQQEIIKSGNRRIAQLVQDVAHKKDIDLVIKKPAVIHVSRKDNEDPLKPLDAKDITSAVRNQFSESALNSSSNGR